MRISFEDDIDAFVDQVSAFLLEEEATNNLILSVCRDLQGGRYSDVTPVLARAVEGSRTLMMACQTPPHGLLLSHCREASVLPRLAQALADQGVDLPGAMGETPNARRFAKAWQDAKGTSAHISRKSRIFRLTEVQPPAPIAGEMRVASDEHRELVADWMIDFAKDVSPDGPISLDRLVANADRRIDRGDTFLWTVDGNPVSTAAIEGRTPHGRRISYVFTPPAFRKRGFAAALVAGASQTILDRGHDFCFLFADRANPASNRVYEKIGYGPVCEQTEYRFG